MHKDLRMHVLYVVNLGEKTGVMKNLHIFAHAMMEIGA